MGRVPERVSVNHAIIQYESESRPRGWNYSLDLVCGWVWGRGCYRAVLIVALWYVLFLGCTVDVGRNLMLIC